MLWQCIVCEPSLADRALEPGQARPDRLHATFGALRHILWAIANGDKNVVGIGRRAVCHGCVVEVWEPSPSREQPPPLGFPLELPSFGFVGDRRLAPRQERVDLCAV